MQWWVSYGGDDLIEHGTPNMVGWMTYKEALECARRQTAMGQRVVEIRSPTGEGWDEEQTQQLLQGN